MYAIIETGGKQYKVSKGDKLDVEMIEGQPKEEVVLDKVLLAHDGQNLIVGRPYIESASVTCNIVGQIRGVKTISFKYRSKKDSKVKKGHRQYLTKIGIKEIKVKP